MLHYTTVVKFEPQYSQSDSEEQCGHMPASNSEPVVVHKQTFQSAAVMSEPKYNSPNIRM